MDNCLFSHKVTNFSKHKDNLINLINKMPLNKFENISNTDGNLPKNIKRTYLDYFIKNIYNDFSLNFCNYFSVHKLELINIWFQQYKKVDNHSMHTHPGAHFANVFYIKLPHKKLKTKIISFNEKELNFETKEGNIVSFPAFYKHESPTNNCKEDKLVISFNTNILYP
tara:strand:+ start:571 stop:1074 length:504 start_codon:yes stop_codon:yes gene_type:complete